jgi:hypothetical protein
MAWEGWRRARKERKEGMEGAGLPGWVGLLTSGGRSWAAANQKEKREESASGRRGERSRERGSSSRKQGEDVFLFFFISSVFQNNFQ